MEQTPKPAETPPAKGKKTWVVIAAVVVIVVVVVAGLYFAGYLGGGPGGAGTPLYIFENPRGTCSTSANCGYTPDPLSVTRGTRVTFTFNSTIIHTATACSTANSPTATECPTMNASLPSFDSGTTGLSNGQTYSVTFSDPGTYYYYCRFHNWMHGSVAVSA